MGLGERSVKVFLVLFCAHTCIKAITFPSKMSFSFEAYTNATTELLRSCVDETKVGLARLIKERFSYFCFERKRFEIEFLNGKKNFKHLNSNYVVLLFD